MTRTIPLFNSMTTLFISIFKIPFMTSTTNLLVKVTFNGYLLLQGGYLQVCWKFFAHLGERVTGYSHHLALHAFRLVAQIKGQQITNKTHPDHSTCWKWSLCCYAGIPCNSINVHINMLKYLSENRENLKH
jgi:hypothetical protein